MQLLTYDMIKNMYTYILELKIQGKVKILSGPVTNHSAYKENFKMSNYLSETSNYMILIIRYEE